MTPKAFPPPPSGVAEDLGDDIRRLLAPNPSPMTYWGTNTYLVGQRGLAVIDPGPDNHSHLQAILGALGPGQTISHILVTHSHLDHSPLAARLAAETGAPVLAFGDHLTGRSGVMTDLAASGLLRGGEGVDIGFTPHEVLNDGDKIAGDGWQIVAYHSPGHFGNHMCFSLEDIVFTGDLVMGWASSLVSPPDGDLTDFMQSCQRIKTLNARIYHAGHGAPITDPAGRMDWLIDHRRARESSILSALAEGPTTVPALTSAIYTDTPAALLPAAERNVLAHLIDLHQRKLCMAPDGLRADAVFALQNL